MGADNRVTYRRRHCYATKSNKIKKVKTPGGTLVAHYIAKRARNPSCGDCKQPLHGLPALRPKQFKNVAKRVRTVSRAYGGSRCASCVKDRYVDGTRVDEWVHPHCVGPAGVMRAVIALSIAYVCVCVCVCVCVGSSRGILRLSGDTAAGSLE